MKLKRARWSPEQQTTPACSLAILNLSRGPSESVVISLLSGLLLSNSLLYSWTFSSTSSALLSITGALLLPGTEGAWASVALARLCRFLAYSPPIWDRVLDRINLVAEVGDISSYLRVQHRYIFVRQNLSFLLQKRMPRSDKHGTVNLFTNFCCVRLRHISVFPAT